MSLNYNFSDVLPKLLITFESFMDLSDAAFSNSYNYNCITITMIYYFTYLLVNSTESQTV